MLHIRNDFLLKLPSAWYATEPKFPWKSDILFLQRKMSPVEINWWQNPPLWDHLFISQHENEKSFQMILGWIVDSAAIKRAAD